MPQDDADQKKIRSGQAGSVPPSASPANAKSWLRLPAPVKQLFDRFPLQTYPPNQLPARSREIAKGNTLFIFTNDGRAIRGLPSANPGCLKWQTFLHFQGIEFSTRPSSNHASPTGALPFLLPESTGAGPSVPIPSDRILTWTRNVSSKRPKPNVKTNRTSDGESTPSQMKADPSGSAGSGAKPNMRYEAYLSLLDTRIRNAYLHRLYLSPPNFTAVASPLYIEPSSSNPLVRIALGHQLHSIATSELLKSHPVIDPKTLYRESDEAFSALSTLLGEDDYFFGVDTPGLFDASVFAYTNVLLDGDLPWQDRRLMQGIRRCENLVAHRERILVRYYEDAGTDGRGISHF